MKPMGRYAKRSIFVATICALSATALVFTKPVPAEAGSAEGRFIHLNIQGLVGRGTDGVANDAARIEAANYIATRVLDEDIIAVSLNEVCQGQATYIDWVTPLSGLYAWRFFRPYHSGAGQHCRNSSGSAEYGNAILMRYSVDGSQPYYSSDGPQFSNGSTLWSNTTCMWTSVYLLSYHACTSHNSGGSDIADLYNYSVFSGAMFKLAMGDLNQDRPGTGPFFLSSSAFREADLSSPKHVTWDGNTAIDYIYIAKQNTGPGQPVRITRIGYSDHHTIRGYFWLYW